MRDLRENLSGKKYPAGRRKAGMAAFLRAVRRMFQLVPDGSDRRNESRRTDSLHEFRHHAGADAGPAGCIKQNAPDANLSWKYGQVS